MPPICRHQDSQGAICTLSLGHPSYGSRVPGHRYSDSLTETDKLRRVSQLERGGGSTCMSCGGSLTHSSGCNLYFARLERLALRGEEAHVELKARHTAYVKENPSRHRIKQLLQRRAAHIVELQAAMTRRNEVIELVSEERDVARGERDSARRQVNFLEQQVADLEANQDHDAEKLRTANELIDYLHEEINKLRERLTAAGLDARVAREESATAWANQLEQVEDVVLVEELLRRVKEDQR